MPGGGAKHLAVPGPVPSTGCAPPETYERSRGVGSASPPTRLNPRGVRLTFEALSTRRIGTSGSPIPLRPFAGPWGLPARRRPRPIARPTRLAPVAFASPPRLSLEAACRASSLRASRDAPLLGFPALQHIPDPRVHLHGGSEPSATFRPQGFNPLAGFLPASPPGLVSCRSAPGLRPSGVSSSRSVAASFRRPLTSTTFVPPPEALLPALGISPSVGAIRGLVLEASRPGNPRFRTPCDGRPEAVPLVGFILPGARSPATAPPPIRRPSPHGLPGGHRGCPLFPPRSSGVLDGRGTRSAPGVERPLRGSSPL